MIERKFKRVDKDKYSLAENNELGKLCPKYKEEYGKKIDENKNTVNFNEKRKKHIKITKRRICMVAERCHSKFKKILIFSFFL